ncbi:MAG: thiolase family protein [Lachnospiraceae bacterium]|nr:thiolase family protein [Lachnospiraceae bacterium]
MERVFLINGARSYIGTENGMYRNMPAEQLGAAVLRQVAEPYRELGIDLLIAGNAVGGGGNIARLALLEAGLPEEIPAFTVDLQCGSGLESIALAAAKIQSGQADLVIAGGFDSSSTAPDRRYHKNHPDYEQYGGGESWYSVAKFVPGRHMQTAMLDGAERTAAAEGITRQDLDPWVLRSHRLARQARESGVLQDIQIEVVEGCHRDEGIRDRMNQRLLDRLPCVLKNGQVITAANACLTNDGAAFVVLCSQKLLHYYQWQPQAEFLGAVEVGDRSEESPRSAVTAVQKLLQRYHYSPEDIAIFECNEAFAVIDEMFARTYPQMIDRYNILGGALAYGHPYGASGGIITLHAQKALESVGGGLAVCSVAAAGGVGTAVLLRSC